MPLKLITIALCAGLYFWGGYSFKQARVSIMPFILGIVCAYLTACWWVFFAVFAGCQVMRLGYGEDSPLYKIFGSWMARGIWAMLVAGLCVAGLVAGHFIGFWAIVYVLSNFFVAALLCKNEAIDWIIDPAIGACIGSVVLYI